jgi:hypothetical protein
MVSWTLNYLINLHWVLQLRSKIVFTLEQALKMFSLNQNALRGAISVT